MRNETTHWECFEKIPPQGGPQDNRNTTSARTGWWVGVSLARERDSRGGIIGGGDLCLPSPEYSCTVHCDQAHYGSVSGGGAEDRFKGGQTVMGSGRLGLGGDVEGVSGGGTDRGG